LIELGGFLPSNPLYWLCFNKTKKNYVKIINKLDDDLIISINFPATYFVSKAKKIKQIKHVYYCFEPFRYFHDRKFFSTAPFYIKFSSWLLRIIFRKIEVKSVLLADEIICISNFIKKRVKEVYKLNSHLYLPGIKNHREKNELNALSLKKRFNISEDNYIIFALGFSHHLKGARELFYIFKKIINKIPNTVLLIGGLITKENYYIMLELREKLEIPRKNVLFAKFVEEKDLNYFYSQSTLTFYTAIEESYGLIPLESMKNGTPVIAFEGGPSETILNGKSGYIIKSNELNDFSKKAIKLIEDKSLHENFSKYAKKHVKENFNIEKKISELESILRHLL
ncbi:hypothetical protein LCGC14_2038460, partial [marine sediment metagenome]